MTPPQPPEQPAPRRFTWAHALGITLVVALIGAGLGWWRPLWLAPPHLTETPILYILLGLAWIPVLIVCRLLHPVPARRYAVSLILAVLISASTGMVLITNGLQAVSDSIAPPKCNSEPLPDHQVRYTCYRSLIMGGWKYTFEGAENSPFGRLVNAEIYGN